MTKIAQLHSFLPADNICRVEGKIVKVADKIIWLSYFALAAVTPLIFSTQNSELFEVPKMHLVYLLAVIIFFSTLIKVSLGGKLLIPKNRLLATFFVFLAIQTLSTATSIDKFTSIFGYPTRLNGGLLSQASYFVILACALINLNPSRAKKLLMTIVITALAVALWGIPAHFGRDPSCLILTSKLTSTCWQKEFDPQLRIFSTLGQPNWLASYLVIVLPLSVAFILINVHQQLKVLFTAATLILFTALVMTNSRAGFLGGATALILFLIFLLQRFETVKQNIKVWLTLGLGFLLITAVFGTTLFSRIGEAISSGPSQETRDQNLSTRRPASLPAQPGGTESSVIRLIVWKGAIKIFKHWPALGSGPETFAYSYYKFRPIEHNQTTEWNFFYNKAHNEFLNYLASTGTLGILAYLGFIVTLIASLLRSIRTQGENSTVLSKAALAGFSGYLATIFFGFSTVATQVTSYLTIVLVLTFQTPKFFEIKLIRSTRFFSAGLLLILGVYVLSWPTRLYLADLLITGAKDRGQNFSTIAKYQAAIETFPVTNPFYLADLAFAQAAYSSVVENEDKTREFAQKAAENVKTIQALSPNNLILERRVANSLLLISDVDESYEQKALESGKKLIQLAPNDPQSYLSLAKIQTAMAQRGEARKTLEQALNLKPDYEEAKELLEQLK